jgi:hypothetical protein
MDSAPIIPVIKNIYRAAMDIVRGAENVNVTGKRD